MSERQAFSVFLVIFVHFICKPSECAYDCGKSKHVEGLIIGGSFVNHGDYPWIAALVDLTSQKFFCGGNLISNSHVITAAHCIQQKSTRNKLLPKDIVVLLGKHNLNLTIERGSVALYIDQFFVHPDWRSHTDDYDADIAILQLQQSVTFSEHISPICWPSRSDSEQEFVGTVVGWGKSEDDTKIHEDTPKEVTVKAVKNEVCFLDQHEFVHISSKRTFCASAENAGPCMGDSGGGLFVHKNSRWIIRGIVSSSLLDRGKCDVTKYTVYTNTIQYSGWVRKILSQNAATQSIVDEIIAPDDGEDLEHHITIDCAYTEDGGSDIAIPAKKLYSCFVETFDQPQQDSIAHIHGKHSAGYSNQDVEEFRVLHKNAFPYIPMNIGHIFPNLGMFFIGEGSHLKSIERKNFDGMSRVTSLFLGYNDLVDIPYDSFYDLFSMRALFIDNNKLRSLHRDTLVRMPKLERLIAHNNQIEYLDSGIFRRNHQLNFINLLNNRLRTIGVNFMQLKNIEWIEMKGNQCIDSDFPALPLNEFQDLINKNCKN